MEHYIVTGMSCAACQARVEKAVNGLDSVQKCNVNLLTHTMQVEGSAGADEVIGAVTEAGYGAYLVSDDTADSITSSVEEELMRKLRNRLLSSVVILIPLMYFSMGHMMFGLPVPAFMAERPLTIGLLQMFLAVLIMDINRSFFISGIKALIHLAPNMDSLIAIGSLAAFVYSVIMLAAGFFDTGITGGAQNGGYMSELYFESAGMILTLITVGKMLEAYSKGRTTDAIKGLKNLAPQTACIIEDGKEKTVPIDMLKVGDIFVVRPGESFPVDGEVLEGSSAVDEAALTGESIPVDKAPGDNVTSATINQSGFLKCRAIRVGGDTTLSRIISLVSDANAGKAPIARLADRISGVFVPVVICIAVITTLIWLLLGENVGFALARGICVLVVSCPCALGLATPVAIMVGSGVGAKNGILFKTAESLQETGRVVTVALDKTGTITSGRPVVTDVVPADGVLEDELLMTAYELESRSEHPLARAVVDYVKESPDMIRSGEKTERKVSGFSAVTGNGLTAIMDGMPVYAGKKSFISQKSSIPEKMEERASVLSQEGKTPLYFSKDGSLLGIIAVADTLKEDSREAVAALYGMGIDVVMLTGDNARTAETVALSAGIRQVYADLLPGDKALVINKLKEKGRVAVVGDGINDAPALTGADTGIAIGAGTDIAIDAADVVLMKSSLCDVPATIKLSRCTYRNIKENLFWALFYNTLLIPAAAGLYTGLGITMEPMLGAAAMSLSSFCVVSNALRLNLVKVHERTRNGKRKDQNRAQADEVSKVRIYGPENINRETGIMSDDPQKMKGAAMTKELKIEGMMCEHCEARVKKALESLDGVSSAEVSHKAGTAVVSMNKEISDETLKKCVEDNDYKVLDIVF